MRTKEFIKELTHSVKFYNMEEAAMMVTESIDALEVAMATGNTILVFAMASHIQNISGISNGEELSRMIHNYWWDLRDYEPEKVCKVYVE